MDKKYEFNVDAKWDSRMAMNEADFTVLRRTIQLLSIEENNQWLNERAEWLFSIEPKYQEGGKGDLYMRIRWDLYWSIRNDLEQSVRDNYREYTNDEMDTALRRLVIERKVA